MRHGKCLIHKKDRQKEKRERDVIITCTDLSKSMEDVALIMMPDDGNFTTAITRSNHKAVKSDADPQTLVLDQFGW